MKKIPTLYVRDPETNLRYVKNEVHPDCQWVIDGEGRATYKWDGTAVMIDDVGVVYKRREVKAGSEAPSGFIQEGETDPNTGKRVGWVLVNAYDPNDRWIIEAIDNITEAGLLTGTYELVGPKVQGNPHQLSEHTLMRHGGFELNRPEPPSDFVGLSEFLRRKKHDDEGFEGLVWHHPDGRMAKIKVRDFPKPA